MNIDDAWFYASADLKEWKNHITKNACFDCSQKKYWHKNCLINSYNKIHQVITFNENEQAVSFRKTYITFIISSKMSDKKYFILFCIVTSCIMSSDELKNKSFWD